jgi:hypothetical protein
VPLLDRAYRLSDRITSSPSYVAIPTPYSRYRSRNEPCLVDLSSSYYATYVKSKRKYDLVVTESDYRLSSLSNSSSLIY